MDSDSIGSIITLCILVLISAFFSASETAFSSLNRIRMKRMAENGSSRANMVVKLLENYDKLCATIVIGTTILNIVAASVATLLFVKHFDALGPILSILIITIAVMIFVEISPKSLAKESPERYALFAAPLLRAFVVLLTPISFLFSQWKKFLGKLLHAQKEQNSITEEELLTIVEEAENEGVINEDDKQLINSVIEFNDCKVSEIITPRVDILGAPLDTPYEEITELFLDSGYSRIPIYEGSMDHIIGVIHLRDFFDMIVNKKQTLNDVLAPVVYVTPSAKISDLLKMFQKEKTHMAVVTDEYGGTLGIVTIEDILEELVGEIWDEHDEIIEELTRIGENTYRVMGSMDVDELFALFGMEGEIESTSVSGFIMEQLNKIPEEGDIFEYGKLLVTVTKTDHRRALECVILVKEQNDTTALQE